MDSRRLPESGPTARSTLVPARPGWVLRTMKETWHISELRKYLSTHAQNDQLDTKTVFLSNPKQRKEIDDIICTKIWPGVTKGVVDSPVIVTLGKHRDLIDNIIEEWHVDTTKSLTFLLSDPERPLGVGSNIRWYCRGKIQCSVLGYMISFDFYIFFPFTFNLKKILVLLKDDAFKGMPPELSYEYLEDGEGEFIVKFSKGSGAGWGLRSYKEAEDHAFREVQNNLDIIYALNKLEVDYRNAKSFEKLHGVLIRAYGDT
jgi:hypothetical protein